MRLDTTQGWFQYLSSWQQDLVKTAYQLEYQAQSNPPVADYSYIVFPMSKAFEGFLKKLLFDLHLIDQKTYEGKRFRIGRSLNPDVNYSQRDEFWLFDDVEKKCSKEVALQLWNTWLECRNRIFHYFPKQKKGMLTHQQAVEKVEQVQHAMEATLNCSGLQNSNINSNQIFKVKNDFEKNLIQTE